MMTVNMQTVEKIRREWLIELIKQHKTIANLNLALGRSKTDATLSQIKNQAVDSKSGNPRNMGSPLAREIESKLNLEVGSLDHPVYGETKDQWKEYRSADDAIKILIDYLLDDNKASLPGWADSDAMAYVDSIELKIRKWLIQEKNSYCEEKARA
ncbi:hypothetical protein [Candidatus Symbiopectobacterium endolongispinus]|uniref:hypothetical protein n=1 Tax=Candidatus Symbiopectobacterium endolongispinus TaxID=2812664 RepID=UPI00207B0395|nr:hypothetical protein [Candidatus Symbiopectobacterium endolongispinus]MBT9428912.1 hypothetical protein [Candidatus Symbiopectobacterium endolongispinus]